MKLVLVDVGDTHLTKETTEIVEAAFEEAGFNTDEIDYYDLSSGSALPVLSDQLVVAMGANAVKALCKTDVPLDKYAGSLTWNEDINAWVLPTHHPNCIYLVNGDGQPIGYGKFDVVYDHLRRAVDLAVGNLPLPSVENRGVDWEFIGHNGSRGGYGGDERVWSGYFEATEEEVQRQWYVLDLFLDDLDTLPQGELIWYGLDTESFTTDHFKPMTMIQVYDPVRNKAFAFTWGVIKEHKQLWRRFFAHHKARWVLANTKHDRKMIRHWLGVTLSEHDDDVMCWSMGLTEKANQTGLKYNSRQYCNAPFYEEALDEWLDKSDINYGHIRPDVLAEYGCLDVYYTRQLKDILPPLAEREGTTFCVTNTLLPAQRTFADMEYDGILVDQHLAAQLTEEWKPKIAEAIQKVQEYAASVGFPADPKFTKNQVSREICVCVPVSARVHLDGIRCTSYGKLLRESFGINPQCETCANKRYVRVVDNTINVHSNPQMQHLCFDMLGMEMTWEGRKTNKYFWEINADHEFAKLVAEYRELDYLQRNIVEGFAKFIREDGRVHPDFLLFGTKTGRLAVHNPPMQTVPSRSKNGKRVKELFLPDPGDYVVNVDYSNLELYMAHHLTGDEALLEALQNDMHLMTAAAMYKKAAEDITDAERSSAKPVNFGAGYNIKARKLSRDPNLVKITGGSTDKAQQYLDAFWGKYRVWAEVKEGWKREAIENCELTTEMGRKRRWSLITSDNAWKVENQATNFKGQSLASDLCLTSLITLQRRLTTTGYGRVLMSVHDSIVFSIHANSVHQAVQMIEEVMTTPQFETTTPFKVDVGIGKNYGEACSVKYDPEADYGISELS